MRPSQKDFAGFAGRKPGKLFWETCPDRRYRRYRRYRLIVLSVLIAVMIIPRAISLLREVFSVLAESAPKNTHVSEIRDHLLPFDGVRSVHDVHVWQLTRGAPVFTAHVKVDPALLATGRSDLLLEELQDCLTDNFDVAHSTFQIESAEAGECEDAHA